MCLDLYTIFNYVDFVASNSFIRGECSSRVQSCCDFSLCLTKHAYVVVQTSHPAFIPGRKMALKKGMLINRPTSMRLFQVRRSPTTAASR